MNGRPAIIYSYAGGLVYIRAADAWGGTWGSTQNIGSDADEGNFCSLAVINGNPAVAYSDWPYSLLKFVRATDADGATWGAPVSIAGTGTATNASMTTVNGYPATVTRPSHIQAPATGSCGLL